MNAVISRYEVIAEAAASGTPRGHALGQVARAVEEATQQGVPVSQLLSVFDGEDVQAQAARLRNNRARNLRRDITGHIHDSLVRRVRGRSW